MQENQCFSSCFLPTFELSFLRGSCRSKAELVPVNNFWTVFCISTDLVFCPGCQKQIPQSGLNLATCMPSPRELIDKILSSAKLKYATQLILISRGKDQHKGNVVKVS